MDQHSHDRPAPLPGRSRARGLVRWAYTNNPFYVISADLVFLGLRVSFDTSGRTFETGALMAALLGYTLLLATMGCLLIRLGRVWDDTRTILLLVVAMFLAISVTFDETLAANPGLGRSLCAGGLVFAVAVTEGVLRVIRLRLPALYRGPYYLILALFFLYPVALSPLIDSPESPRLQWALFGFSPLAGAAFLTLVPAVRRGAAYLAKNGSPWRYPLYPWVLFGLLAVGVCGRAYYLCISFHFVPRTPGGPSPNIFGPYFLVPILFALDVLWFEAGLASRRRYVPRAALLVLPVLAAVSVAGERPDPVYWRFQHLFVSGLGASPLFLTVAAAGAFTAYAAARRVPLASGLLTCELIALSVIAPGTLDVDGLVAPQPLPMLAAGVLQLAVALRRNGSFRALVGTGLVLAAVALQMAHSGLADDRGPVLFHLAVAGSMLLGLRFTDEFGRWLGQAGAWLLALGALAAAWGGAEQFPRVRPELVAAYPVLAAAACWGFGALTGCRPYLHAAAVSLTGWAGAAGWSGYHALRRAVAGLDWIAGGLAFFSLAAFISLLKAGLVPKWAERRADDAT
jgi:hypothetical protein